MTDRNHLTACVAADNRVTPCVEVVARLTAADTAERVGLDPKPLRRTAERFAHVHLDEIAMRERAR